MKNTNKGITLIALVITIIVLLILAGTAISIAVNGGNIFAKANTAVESYNAKVAQQQAAIETLNTQFDAYYTEYDPIEPDPTLGWDTTKVSSIVQGTITVDGQLKNAVAPIPTGFVVSDISTEDEISEGLVIYQGTDPVSTDEDAITTRNQFVWIPVTNINSMIMCKSNAEGSICDIELLNGELHCKTHDTTGATNMCSRLYRVNPSKDNDASTASGKNVYGTSMNYTLRTQTFSDASEPSLVTTFGMYEYNPSTGGMYQISDNYHGLANDAEFLTQLQNDFYSMAKSVALYKGFYISRYEAGYASSTYTSKKGQVVMNASATANVGANMWYGLYKHLRTTLETLNSQMIWGCQYDQAIKFIKQNSVSPELDPEIGHTNIGLKTSKDVSGATGVGDIMKNIYDLEGNLCEWTAEPFGSYFATLRGNDYTRVSSDNFNPASLRGDLAGPDSTTEYYGSRSGLYL